MKLRRALLGCLIFAFGTCFSQSSKHQKVEIVGAMRNVMWKGELFGNIYLDTISDKTNLYGLGPLEYLAGEILIIDGKAYRSTVVSKSQMKVEETYRIKAPFFGYTRQANWMERTLPDSISTYQQLESYLKAISKSSAEPLMFKLSGIVEKAKIHVVNLPKGVKVSNPDQAHQGQVNYEISDEPVDIVGFYSTRHQGIFTHHSTFLHLHLITDDRKKMGHLDEVLFKKGMKLYLPKE